MLGQVSLSIQSHWPWGILQELAKSVNQSHNREAVMTQSVLWIQDTICSIWSFLKDKLMQHSPISKADKIALRAIDANPAKRATLIKWPPDLWKKKKSTFMRHLSFLRNRKTSGNGNPQTNLMLKDILQTQAGGSCCNRQQHFPQQSASPSPKFEWFVMMISWPCCEEPRSGCRCG